MERHDIITIYHNTTRTQQILDTGYPVGFEAEMAKVKELNEKILDILTGQHNIQDIGEDRG